MATPGLDGYRSALQDINRSTLTDVQTLGGLMQATALSDKINRERAYRSEIAAAGPNAEEAVLNDIAIRHAGPEGVVNALNRRASIKATQEATMQRLQQQASQFEANWQIRYQNARTNAERLRLEQFREGFKQHLQSEAARLAGARGAYDFGFAPNATAPNVPMAPPPLPPSTPAPVPGMVQPGSMQIPPAVQAARDAAAARIRTAELQPDGGGMIPTSNVVQGSAPFTPEDPEARRLAVGPTQATTAPVEAAPSAIPPMPPEIASAPPRVQNQWRLQQIKTAQEGKKKADRPITEFQGKNALYGMRSLQADSILQSLEDQISLVGLASKQTVQGIPVIGGPLGAGANALLSDSQQKVEQAQRNFVNAVLRQESGAVISDQEFENAKKQYFPQPGDSEAVIKQKRENRATAISGFKRIAGPAWNADEETKILESAPQAATAYSDKGKEERYQAWKARQK